MLVAVNQLANQWTSGKRCLRQHRGSCLLIPRQTGASYPATTEFLTRQRAGICIQVAFGNTSHTQAGSHVIDEVIIIVPPSAYGFIVVEAFGWKRAINMTAESRSSASPFDRKLVEFNKLFQPGNKSVHGLLHLTNQSMFGYVGVKANILALPLSFGERRAICLDHRGIARRGGGAKATRYVAYSKRGRTDANAMPLGEML